MFCYASTFDCEGSSSSLTIKSNETIYKTNRSAAEWGLADKRPNCQPLREVVHQVLRLPVQKMNKNGVPRTTLA